jgi:hypothetical protein
MMTIHTYIPVKNCNIVQIEAEVAIMSLKPSIANDQAVIFCASRKNKLLLDDDAATGNKPTQHMLPVVFHAKCNVTQVSKKCFITEGAEENIWTKEG